MQKRVARIFWLNWQVMVQLQMPSTLLRRTKMAPAGQLPSVRRWLPQKPTRKMLGISLRTAQLLRLNDLSETKAVKAAFGDLAYKIPISSTKSMTGHMMGATGALEAIFCVQAIREGILPPTIHYETPDPECDLDYIPNKAREKKIDLAISNAFGFGGHNAVLAMRRSRYLSSYTSEIRVQKTCTMRKCVL